jgi:hypothetical protein
MISKNPFLKYSGSFKFSPSVEDNVNVVPVSSGERF